MFSFEVLRGKLTAVPSSNRSTVVGTSIDRNLVVLSGHSLHAIGQSLEMGTGK